MKITKRRFNYAVHSVCLIPDMWWDIIKGKDGSPTSIRIGMTAAILVMPAVLFALFIAILLFEDVPERFREYPLSAYFLSMLNCCHYCYWRRATWSYMPGIKCACDGCVPATGVSLEDAHAPWNRLTVTVRTKTQPTGTTLWTTKVERFPAVSGGKTPVIKVNITSSPDREPAMAWGYSVECTDIFYKVGWGHTYGAAAKLAAAGVRSAKKQLKENLEASVEGLTPEQKLEYSRYLDSALRGTHSFEPSLEQQYKALQHAEFVKPSLCAYADEGKDDCMFCRSRKGCKNMGGPYAVRTKYPPGTPAHLMGGFDPNYDV